MSHYPPRNERNESVTLAGSGTLLASEGLIKPLFLLRIVLMDMGDICLELT